MQAKKFWARHRRNPYEADQDPTLVNRSFWNRFQFAIYFDVIKAKKNLFVDVRSIDRYAMEKDPEYFGEALQMCSQLNILRIMQFNKDFDADLVAQFFATVHLGTDEERTLTWMTNGKLLLSSGRPSWSYLRWKITGLRLQLAFVLTAIPPPLKSKLSGSTVL